MGQVSRRHHTVPRFYLERFADAGDRVQQVWLPGDRQHPVSISSGLVIRGFYNINIGTQQEPTMSDFWEKRFSEVEGMAAKAFEAVVDDRIWPPRDHDRDAIALWAALQHLRSPAIRNQQQDHMGRDCSYTDGRGRYCAFEEGHDRGASVRGRR